jgi:hypothetical protein
MPHDAQSLPATIFPDDRAVGVSLEESTAFTESAIALRELADGLYRPEFDRDEPALDFDPSVR